ncbi:hypothetical protein NDU88_002769 [Pleurodeles waltl]|uniref:Uncharacterized protein n=1 Tax=Pleurodeles waltl TaxID=8319 RepID=A0AAV7UY21_PLEWA|nr:hypothetical protein NDU88_002769 [Pleurodeles waltl]
MGRCPGNASCGCKEASTGQKKLRFLQERKGLETSPLVDGSLSPWRVVQKCFPPEGRQQALLHANHAFGSFGRCWGPRGTRRSQIGPEERGDVGQDKEPSLKQVAPGEVPETGTTRMRETVLTEVAQRSPTSPETNLESRAMQVRVPWTQAWLCTKDFRRKCTGAGVAAKSRFPAMQPSEVRQGLTSTKLGLKSHWTVGVTWTASLDSRDLARRAERRPKGPVMQLFGACGCRGKIPSTHGRFLRSFWCREEAGYPHSMHKQEDSREGGRISVTELQ